MDSRSLTMQWSWRQLPLRKTEKETTPKPEKAPLKKAAVAEDGKRKPGTQMYHGRGTVHIHVLVWLGASPELLRLEQEISATVPDEDPELKDLVVGGQWSYTEPAWPVQPMTRVVMVIRCGQAGAEPSGREVTRLGALGSGRPAACRAEAQTCESTC